MNSDAVLFAASTIVTNMAEGTERVVAEIGNLSVTLGGIYDMATEEPKYIPLDDFMTEKLLADAQSDFDSSELVFEWELKGGE